MSVSIVIPVHNTGQYLEKSFEGIKKQVYENTDIIIVENGSTDDSPAICDQYKELATVIHTEKAGLSYARNVGIEHAHGHYIIFPDPDDWVDPDYILYLIALHDNYQTDLEICGYTIEPDGKSCEGEKTVFENKHDMHMALLHPYGFCGFAWNKLYHMDIIQKHHLRFDESLGMAQDLEFTFRYMSYCERIIFDPISLYHYSRENGGVTMLTSPLTERKLGVFDSYRRIINETNDEEVKHLCRRAIFNTTLDFIYAYYYNKMNDPILLSMLISNLEAYQRDFFQDDLYSIRRKAVAHIAMVSPKLFYHLMNLKRRHA